MGAGLDRMGVEVGVMDRQHDRKGGVWQGSGGAKKRREDGGC